MPGRMLRVALTGSIGMGKSTTLSMFREAGVPVYSADEQVHKLYSGKAAPLIEAAFPGTVLQGVVDREKLSGHVIGNPQAMRQLESIVHPLVREAEMDFVNSASSAGAPFAVLDIPLLFETGSGDRFDHIIVVSTDPQTQRSRVMARPGMTEEKFEAILARQIPDPEKRARADFVIDTGKGLEHVRNHVAQIARQLTCESQT